MVLELAPCDFGMELSKDQEVALSAIYAWVHTSNPILTLGGFAGTGKSFLISRMLEELKTLHINVCAFTGKAASVLRAKGVSATTMHALIYQPEEWCSYCERVVEKSGKQCFECGKESVKTRFIRVPFIDSDLVIVDEASMLNLSHVQDLQELAPKVLYVGDHGQLEPIGEDPGIMRNPQIRLEKIHRQAETSQIISFAHHVRLQRDPSSWSAAKQVRVSSAHEDGVTLHRDRPTGNILNQFDIVICGYNNTRLAVNSSIRKLRGFKDELPEIGERLICLQNDSDLGIFNGLLVTVIKRHDNKNYWDYQKYDLADDTGKEYFEVPVHPDQFGKERRLDRVKKGLGMFDYGYCLTTHKSQGSAWDKVAVLEQIGSSWEKSRWRYTAATRAAKQLDWWTPSG